MPLFLLLFLPADWAALIPASLCRRLVTRLGIGETLRTYFRHIIMSSLIGGAGRLHPPLAF